MEKFNVYPWKSLMSVHEKVLKTLKLKSAPQGIEFWHQSLISDSQNFII